MLDEYNGVKALSFIRKFLAADISFAKKVAPGFATYTTILFWI